MSSNWVPVSDSTLSSWLALLCWKNLSQCRGSCSKNVVLQNDTSLRLSAYHLPTLKCKVFFFFGILCIKGENLSKHLATPDIIYSWKQVWAELVQFLPSPPFYYFFPLQALDLYLPLAVVLVECRWKPMHCPPQSLKHTLMLFFWWMKRTKFKS
jgi:hypothetical protein